VVLHRWSRRPISGTRRRVCRTRAYSHSHPATTNISSSALPSHEGTTYANRGSVAHIDEGPGPYTDRGSRTHTY